MTTLTLGQLRQDLATLVDAVPGLRVSAYGQMNPICPMACVLPRRGDYLIDVDADADHSFVVWVYVNGADVERGQQALDEYLQPSGAKSIKAAVDSSARFRVTGYDEYATQLDMAGSKVLAVALNVEVIG